MSIFTFFLKKIFDLNNKYIFYLFKFAKKNHPPLSTLHFLNSLQKKKENTVSRKRQYKIERDRKRE